MSESIPVTTCLRKGCFRQTEYKSGYCNAHKPEPQIHEPDDDDCEVYAAGNRLYVLRAGDCGLIPTKSHGILVLPINPTETGAMVSEVIISDDI